MESKSMFKNILENLDLFYVQPGLFFKGAEKQKTNIGILLSLLMIASTIAISAYFLFGEKYNFEIYNDRQYDLKANIFDYPMLFSIKDQSTGKEIEEEAILFDLEYIYNNTYYYFQFEKCENIQKNADYIEYFHKYKEAYELVPNWKDCYCLMPGNYPHFGTSNNNVYASFYYRVIPEYIIKYQNFTLEINRVFQKINENNPRVEWYNSKVSINFTIDYTVRTDFYFVNSSFSVKGNAIKKSKPSQQFVQADYADISLFYQDFLYQYLLSYSQNEVQKKEAYVIGMFNLNLSDKYSYYVKAYYQISDMLGIIGGYINLFSIGLRLLVSPIALKICQFDIVETLTQSQIKYQNININLGDNSSIKLKADKSQNQLINNYLNNPNKPLFSAETKSKEINTQKKEPIAFKSQQSLQNKKNIIEMNNQSLLCLHKTKRKWLYYICPLQLVASCSKKNFYNIELFQLIFSQYLSFENIFQLSQYMKIYMDIYQNTSNMNPQLFIKKQLSEGVKQQNE